ncbi:MAG: SDR family NAD(P)-dependent oxidoreductase [Actinomycetales bacterium]|nr:SDR family NAD(P)-dependent oxidoreductase [Actinomycetales bacterium]
MTGVLAGRVAVVTGASRGIGYGIARRLAAEGAAVGLIARSPERLAAVADRFDSSRLAVAAADVGDWSQVQAAVAKLTSALGPIDLAVANAGMGIIGPVAEADPQTWAAMMQVNYLGTAHLIRAVLPDMLARGHGDISAIVSAGGTRGYPNWSGYCASKHAVMGFLECLSQEVTSKGVRVGALCPGGVDTPFWDDLNEDLYTAGSSERERLMSPDDVAAMLLAQVTLPRGLLLKQALFFPVNEWH